MTNKWRKKIPPFEYDPKELFEAIARLANERDMSWRRTKKGDKRPAYDIEASKQGRARIIRARQLAATERNLPAHRARNSTARAIGESITDRMLLAMRPGQWYGVGDLMRMVGEPRSSRGKVSQVMLRRGWVEAGHNPAWTGATPNPQAIQAGAEPEPKTVYRLTETGLQERNRLAESIKPA